MSFFPNEYRACLSAAVSIKTLVYKKDIAAIKTVLI